jgi:hypothetical protein
VSNRLENPKVRKRELTDEVRAALLDGNSRLVTVELRKRLLEKGNET